MIRRLLVPIAALATFVTLAGGGAAVAVWTASATVVSTASSATVGTTLTQAGTLATTYRYSGNTSPAVGDSLVITNTGRAPLRLALATTVSGSAALAQRTAVQLWTGTCGTTPPASGVVVTTLADPAPVLPTAARTLAPGAAVTVCVATRITGADPTSSNAALQGQAVTASFQVTGAVGDAWRASASSAAVTQSVYRIASPGAVACAASGTRAVTLSWPAAANRFAGSPVTYRVFDVATGATVASVTTDATSASVTLDGYDFARSGSYPLAVEAKETFSGTTSPATAPTTVTRSTPFNLGLFPSARCS